MAGLGEAHAEDGSGEGFAGVGGRVGGIEGMVGDADVAAEVGLVGWGDVEGDALDGDAPGQGEGGDGLVAALGDRRGADGGGVDGLGLAAGGTVTPETI